MILQSFHYGEEVRVIGGEYEGAEGIFLKPMFEIWTEERKVSVPIRIQSWSPSFSTIRRRKQHFKNLWIIADNHCGTALCGWLRQHTHDTSYKRDHHSYSVSTSCVFHEHNWGKCKCKSLNQVHFSFLRHQNV